MSQFFNLVVIIHQEKNLFIYTYKGVFIHPVILNSAIYNLTLHILWMIFIVSFSPENIWEKTKLICNMLRLTQSNLRI